jgi:ribonuclease J
LIISVHPQSSGRVATSPLRLVALGGLGEIGMNCMVLEADGDAIVIDCGVMFPDRELGVDVIHPDFRWIAERRDRLRGIVLTHGHEDHIGGLPYLLRQANVPVLGPPYALELVRRRLAEHEGIRSVDLRPTRVRTPFRLGCFEVEPIRVTHSIADATALAIRTPAGLVVHTGDFKIDEHPPDGQAFDRERLAQLGDEGVRLLLSDSTNAWVAGRSGEESTVHAKLGELVARAPARVVVSVFASNVHRLRALFSVARDTGRHVVLLGRSVRTHVETATRLGYIPDPGALLVHPDDARELPRSQLLAIATGTQGEALAALARLAADRHPALTLEPGDEVVHSARIIPGHEQIVYRMINDFERRGVTVRFAATDPGVHVSGHAHADEQRIMLSLVRPRGFVPVHGTFLHLKRHEALARSMGVTDTLVVENGAVVEVGGDALRVVDQAPVGRVHVDAGEEIPEAVLRDRARLAELGMAVAVVRVDGRGRPVGEPQIVTRGVLHEEEETEVVADACRFVAEDLAGWSSPELSLDPVDVEERARRALKRYFGRRLGRKPLTWAVVVPP